MCRSMVSAFWFLPHAAFPLPSSPSPPDKPAPICPISTQPSLQAAAFSKDLGTCSVGSFLSCPCLGCLFDTMVSQTPSHFHPNLSFSGSWVELMLKRPNPIPTLTTGHNRSQSFSWHERRFNAPTYKKLVASSQKMHTTPSHFIHSSQPVSICYSSNQWWSMNEKGSAGSQKIHCLFLSAPWHSASRKIPTNFRCAHNLSCSFQNDSGVEQVPQMAELWSVKPEQFPSHKRSRMGLLFLSYQHQRTNTSGKRIPICGSPNLLPTQILACSGQELSLRQKEVHALVRLLPNAAMHVTDTNKHAKGLISKSNLSISIFSPEQSLYIHSRIWLPRIWRTLRCPRGQWTMGIFLCLVITCKLEKSKAKTHAGKLNPHVCLPERMTGKWLQRQFSRIFQNKALFKDIGRNAFSQLQLLMQLNCILCSLVGKEHQTNPAAWKSCSPFLKMLVNTKFEIEEKNTNTKTPQLSNPQTKAHSSLALFCSRSCMNF